MRYAIAVDLGGTKLSAALVSDSGQVLLRRKTAVDRVRTVDQIAAAIRDIAKNGGAEAARCGVIAPGIYFGATGCVWAPNLWGDERVPLRAELEQAAEMPVTIDSDRAGYVIGERWLGAARALNDVIFLPVGTGIGAGIISGGRLLRGAGDIAGAVGWFALNPAHRDLYTRIGCWEAEAAGPALARRAHTRTAEEAVAAARTGDPAACCAIEETARYLGMGIANLVSVLNPEMVVLGGGLMQAADLFLDPIRNAVRLWAQPFAAGQVRIEKTQLGEDAGMLGAARLAFDAGAG